MRARLSACCTKARRFTNSAIDGTRRRDTRFAWPTLADKPQTAGERALLSGGMSRNRPLDRRAHRDRGDAAAGRAVRSHHQRRAHAGPAAQRSGTVAGRRHEQLSVRLAAATEGGRACQPVYPVGTAGARNWLRTRIGFWLTQPCACAAIIAASLRSGANSSAMHGGRSAPRCSWPVIAAEADRWRLRAAMDAVIAHAYGLDRAQYERVLASFSHKSFRAAPALCLAAFDELAAHGPRSILPRS